jgi:predicted RNA-binding protein with PUA-like domain
MNHWLVKSEPHVWSWADQLAAKGRTTQWDGVRNAQAAASLRNMKTGDRVFFYHSGDERRIVGIVQVVGDQRPDPSDESGRSVMVELKAVKPLARPVTLMQIKAHKKLGHLALVRQPRLSVMPIDPVAWRTLCQLGGLPLEP